MDATVIVVPDAAAVAVVILRYHLYPGSVPPLVGVAVKVTGVPLQIVVADAEIEFYTLIEVTVKADVAVRVQPAPPVAVAVYVIEAEGTEVTVRVSVPVTYPL